MRPVPPLPWFQSAILSLHEGRPLPLKTAKDDAVVFRYEQKDITTAILLKTTRFVSGLHAGEVLLKLRFVQELASLQRSLQDFAEDAQFLAMACILKDLTALHEEYLSAFWEEEPTLQVYSKNQRNRPEVPRRKIVSYLAQTTSGGVPDHDAIVLGKYLSRFYSGFVHGSAPTLMDLFNPITKRFEVAGVTHPPILEDHRHDFQNYLFRGVILMAIVARAVGNEVILKEANDLHDMLKPHYV